MEVSQPSSTSWVMWPTLDTDSSQGRGGLHDGDGRRDRYLADDRYWVWQDLDPWRAPKMPFRTVGGALFKLHGATMRFAGKGQGDPADQEVGCGTDGGAARRDRPPG